MPRLPAGLPVLGRGRHRGPRQGACVMEYASVLAGERWSDKPACTHPALAHLARVVNDCTDDGTRQQLITVVPDMVDALGAQGERAQLGQRLARRACLTALPLARGVRRRTLSAALLGAETACDPDHWDADREAVRALLTDPDEAMQLALRLRSRAPTPSVYDRSGVRTSLELAVVTIADARRDELLRDLLVECVAMVRGVPVRRVPARQLAEPS